MLYLIRGLPGSGKSTLAEDLVDHGVVDQYFEADQHFENIKFDPCQLHIAHKKCFEKTKAFLSEGLSVAVSNTFTTKKELDPYIQLAKVMEIPYTVLIAENFHGNTSVHDVPKETVKRMRDRFYYADQDKG